MRISDARNTLIPPTDALAALLRTPILADNLQTLRGSMQPKRDLPWWTWVLPFFLFHLGTRVSIEFQIAPGIGSLYLPDAIALTLVHLWGPRILPAMYLNAIVSARLWGLQDWQFFPLYALPEILQPALSWFLFTKKMKGKAWMPNLREMGKFVLFALVIPSAIFNPALQLQLYLRGHLQLHELRWTTLAGTDSDFLSGVALSIPILVLSSDLTRKGLTLFPNIPPINRFRPGERRLQTLVIATTMLLISAISIVTGPLQPWSLYGVFSMVCALTCGLYWAIVINSWIVFFSLLVPPFVTGNFGNVAKTASYLDLGTLFSQFELIMIIVSSLFIGRAISDADDEIKRRMQTEEELQDQTKQLLEAKQKAEEANQAKSVFLGNMSHEIRTPLSAILGFTDLLKEPDLPSGKRVHYVNIVADNGEQLANLINDILDLSKVESGRLELEPKMISIYEVVEDVFAMLTSKAMAKHISLNIEQATPLPQSFRTDGLRVKQILINLVGNSIKFTSEGGQITATLSYSATTQQIEISLTDTGIGIPRERWETIFEAFHQGDASMTRRFGGTGLGLSFSKKLAQLLHGDLQLIRSEPEKGSTFLVTLSEITS